MNEDQIIADLFEAARKEKAARSLDDVGNFIRASTSGTSSSLIVKWLKQNKMNMLITTGSVLLTATMLLIAPKEAPNESPITEILDPIQEQILVPVPQKEDSMIVHEEPDQVRRQSPPLTEKTSISVEEEDEAEKPDTASRVGSVMKITTSSGQQPVQAEEREVVQLVKDKDNVWNDYAVVLESAKGRTGAAAFEAFLNQNLSQLKHDFTSSASAAEIRKFTLKLDNQYQANFRMQVSGFEKLELSWKADSVGEIKDMWYRLDGKEIKELDFSKEQKFSIRVKHRHEEF